MVLFLDFDGVLHPKGAGHTHFTRLPILEALLRETDLTNVQLVVSSTWRQAYSLTRLRAFFAPDIAERIIGTTASLSDYRSEHERGEEIEAWLSKNGNPAWVALDDDLEGFSPRMRAKLVLVDGAVGLQAEDAMRLRALMAWN